MSIATYNNQKIGLLKQILLNNAESGKPIDYEIRVDEMKVVQRTNDPEQFDNHEEFVTEETRKIVILFYDGNSRRNTRHTFLRKEEEKNPQQNTLSGVEIEKIVSEKLLQEKKQWQQELIEKENKELKEKIEEAEEFIQKQGKIIQDLKSDRKLGDMQWGELIGIAGESILRRNTHLLAKVPGMSELAGVIKSDNKNLQKQVENPEPQAEASFSKPKESNKEQKENSELNKDDNDRLDFLRQLQERFSEEELKQVLTLLNVLVQKPKTIEHAILFAVEWKEKSAEAKTKSETVKPEIKNEKPLQQAETEEEKIIEKQQEEKPEEKEDGEPNKESEVENSTVGSELGNSY